MPQKFAPGGASLATAGEVVRQTVLQAKLDSNRLPDFLDDTVANQVTVEADASNPLILSFAAGFGSNGQADHKKIVTSDNVISSLLANYTYYLYAQYNPVGGAVTFHASEVPPTVMGTLPIGAGEQAATGEKGASLIVPHEAAVGTSGEVTASSQASSYPMWRCFMTYNRSKQISAYMGGFMMYSPWIMDYTFRTAQTVGTYSFGIFHRHGSKSHWGHAYPKDWTLKGSNTGAWGGEETTVDTVTGATRPAIGAQTDFTCDTPGSYKYYRFTFTKNYNNQTSGTLFIGQATMNGLVTVVQPPLGDVYDVRKGLMYDSDDEVVYRVYLGEVTLGSNGAIDRTVCYALRGYYESTWQDLAINEEVTFNHNIGCVPTTLKANLWKPGSNAIHPLLTAGSATTRIQYGTVVANVDRLSCDIQGGSTGLWVPGSNSSGQGADPVPTSSKVRVVAKRGWN